MATAIYLAQIKVLAAGLGSLICGIQAFRASVAGRRLQVPIYSIIAVGLVFLTLVFLPELAIH